MLALKLVLSIILLLFLSNFSKAQEGEWDLKRCIEYAIDNNIEVQQNQLRVRENENDYQQSKWERYPDASAFVNQQFNWGRSVDPFSNDFVNERINSNNFSISSNVTLFDGFRIKHTIEQNKLLIEASQLDVEQAKNNLSLNVALAYLDVLRFKEQLKVNQQQVASTKEQLRRTQILFDAGSVAENDVIDLKAQLANDELTVITTENSIAIAKVNLQQFMNLEVSSTFDIAGTPVENLEVNPITTSTESIYQIAESSQPNIQSADKSIEVSKYDVELAKSGYYPTLSLQGSIFTGFSSARKDFDFVSGTAETIPFFDQVNDNLRQSVSLNLSIPIFSRMRNSNNVANARLNVENAKLDAQNLRIQLRQTIEQAYVDARAAYNTYQARQKQVEALELSFQTSEERYKAGAATIVDFNLIRINYNNAKTDLVQSKYVYLFRQKVLDFYQDKPLY